MGELKKVLVTMPESLLKEMDNLIKAEHVNRSELIRNAVNLYLKEKRKNELKQWMIRGYQEMAEINLTLSEGCFEADEEIICRYEQKLAECE